MVTLFIMMTIPVWLFVALLLVGLIIGASLVANTLKGGRMAYSAEELPKVQFTVVYSDKICTVLRDHSGKKKNFLISTKVFAGNPVRAQMIVRHAHPSEVTKLSKVGEWVASYLIEDKEEEEVQA
jgi:hypothetical protein